MSVEYRKLGHTDIKVSAICLGTMTWGKQNTEAEGHAQMDYAVSQGVNFFDTAELYPIPPEADTQGGTETIIGSWFMILFWRPKWPGVPLCHGSAMMVRQQSLIGHKCWKPSTKA
jgi:hypothetical protein